MGKLEEEEQTQQEPRQSGEQEIPTMLAHKFAHVSNIARFKAGAMLPGCLFRRS
jgi:hypothetical protein